MSVPNKEVEAIWRTARSDLSVNTRVTVTMSIKETKTQKATLGRHVEVIGAKEVKPIKEGIISNSFILEGPCNMCTCSGNGTQERAVQDLLCLVHLYLVYLI